MSVRSFHSVFMATAVAGAALGCYLVSLRVASERAALEQVETQIVSTQADIRMLQTEIGTRARLSQLERWNARALSLSAPAAGQILGDKFQLAKLVRPEPRPDIEAPVVLAAAPAPEPSHPLEQEVEGDSAPVGELLHQASYKTRESAEGEAARSPTKKAAAAPPAAHAPAKTLASEKKAGDKPSKTDGRAVTRPVRTATVDPLAPLPAERSAAKGLRTNR